MPWVDIDTEFVVAAAEILNEGRRLIQERDELTILGVSA
jgi:hypothetical protein